MNESRKKPFLQRRDRWGHGVSLWVIVAVAFLIPVMLWSLRDVRMHNDVAGWLPRKDPQAKILNWYQGMFPSEDRVLVSWDDSAITDPRLRLLELSLEGTPTDGERTEGGSPYVASVTLPTELLQRMLEQDIPFERAMQQLEGILIGRGPLKLRFTDIGRRRGEFLQKEILELASRRFGLDVQVVTNELPKPSGDIPLEDTGAFNVYRELTEYVQTEPLHDLQLSWFGMHTDRDTTEQFRAAVLKMTDPGSGNESAGKPVVAEAFYTPGSLAAVSVSLSEAGIADKKAAVAAIQAAVEAAGVAPEAAHLGGQPVVSVALNEAVSDAAWNRSYEWWDLPHRSPILLSAFLSVLFTYIMLRSLRLASLVVAVSFLTVVISMAVIPLTGATLNMVLIVMPTLLIVLTTSAAIHLSNYWKHGTETDPSRSVFHAAEMAWLPCALASGTTAIGLASLVASNLVPVRDFGIYSAIGCVISFAVVLYVLPSLMLYWPKSPPLARTEQGVGWNRFGRWLARNRYAVTGFCVIITAACGWGLWHFRTETKVIRYFPADSKLVQDYEFLEDKLAGVISVDTIVKFDQQAQQDMSFVDRARKVLELQQDLKNHEDISGVLSLASFLDLRTADAENMTRLDRMKLNRKQKAMERKLHEGIRDGSRSSEASMLALPDYDTDWHESGDRLLNRAGDEVWRITAQTSVLADTNLETLIGDIDQIAREHVGLVGSPHTSHVITGLTPVFLRTQQAVLESLIRSFGLAFAIIAVVMIILLRSPMSGLVTMLPNLMPVILVFGAISWAGWRVDIGTMITASVALGIAVDGTLHLITWFKNLVREGLDVEEAVGRAMEHCGPAMSQTSIAIGLGMFALLPAELLLVSRFGIIMAALIFAALVADIVFLPALLGGSLGRMIQRAAFDPSAASTDETEQAATVRLADPADDVSHDTDDGSQLKEVS